MKTIPGDTWSERYANLRHMVANGGDLRGLDLRGYCLNFGALDLSGCDLRGLPAISLTGCLLTGAILTNHPVPVVPNIDRLMASVVDRVYMHAWHCGTTHCRAGWAIHFAGSAGYELEALTCSSVAGAAIYAASSSLPLPDFYASTFDAREDILERAQ